MRDRDLNAGAIKVETKDGIVQLSGFVPSDEMQSQALQTARAVEGVAEVRNDITVRGTERSGGQVTNDAVIAARVKSSLNDARLSDKGDVNVQVNKGGRPAQRLRGEPGGEEPRGRYSCQRRGCRRRSQQPCSATLTLASCVA